MKTSFLKTGFLVCVFCLVGLTRLSGINKDSLQSKVLAKSTIFNEIYSEPLKEITIITAIDSILLNRKTNKSFPATLTFTDAKGKIREKSIKLKARGKSRRLYCSFPPLKISFSGKELLANGLRKQHRSLKLVTHCNDGLSANRNVLKEFLAYKMYNELTENSLRVQLLKVTYQDINSDYSMDKYAILLEDIDELAERMDGKELEAFGKSINEFDQSNANVFTLFQFMIGNADWKIRTQSNVKFIQSNVNNVLTLVPYDFDSSGMVAPEYARPFNSLGLNSMKQRLFMGQFTSKTARKETVSFFKDKRVNLYSLVKNFKLMDYATRNETKEYLDAFYQIINTRMFLDKAVPVGKRVPETSDPDGAMSF